MHYDLQEWLNTGEALAKSVHQELMLFFLERMKDGNDIGSQIAGELALAMDGGNELAIFNALPDEQKTVVLKAGVVGLMYVAMEIQKQLYARMQEAMNSDTVIKDASAAVVDALKTPGH